MEDGGKTVPDDMIAGELSNYGAAMGTSLGAMNMPHTTGTPSPPPNMGDISESSRERTEAEPERCIAAGAIARPVGKLLGETRLKVEDAVGVIHCRSLKDLLTEILSL